MWHKVAKASDIDQGKMKQVRVMGLPILLANIDGEYFAIGDVCTHRQCNLSTGFLDGNTVICPCHQGQFDLKTGEVISGPPPAPEPTYPVKVENEELYIEV